MRRKEEAPSMAASSIQNTPDELELMKRRLAKLEVKQKSPPEEYTTYRHSPFLEDILTKPLPDKLKMPQLTSYEDSNDPIGHLDRYTSWMELQGASDAIMCRAFPLIFRNRAMRWFKKLPQRSIRSWNDLSSQFVSTFMGARARSIPKERLTRSTNSSSLKSESAFSISNMILEEQDQVNKDILEALICVKDWLFSYRRMQDKIHEDIAEDFKNLVVDED
ncbi:Retrotrans gag domain-containing protein [Abeliophyllum distichum]|uniref:Retrotrans gag domain-containing protein n=1 Tax=Abeliophyllum distichum TaxID=126358 RepID=A0ABD1UHQ6_9LAMI